MQAGLFVREQTLPIVDVDPLDFDVICVPLESIKNAYGGGEIWPWIQELQGAGKRVLVHIPACYLGKMPDGSYFAGEPYDVIKAYADDNEGWLIDPGDEVVEASFGGTYLDMRSSKLMWRALGWAYADFFAAYVGQGGFIPYGVLADCVWAKPPTWESTTPAVWGDLTDAERRQWRFSWQRGMARFAVAFRQQLRRNGLSQIPLVWGNGWHAIRMYDGICYENFPTTHLGVAGDVCEWETLFERYGVARTRRYFRQQPLIIPESGPPAEGASQENVIRAFNFAQTWCPEGTIFDNSGEILDLRDELNR